MKKKIHSILNGIADGIFPSIFRSIGKDENGKMEINNSRLVASVFSWILLIAFLRGTINLESLIELLKVLLTV